MNEHKFEPEQPVEVFTASGWICGTYVAPSEDGVAHWVDLNIEAAPTRWEFLPNHIRPLEPANE